MTDITTQAARSADKGVEWLARIGYTAKGVVYVIVGVLAALAAFGSGGQTTGTKGAVTRLGGEPYGPFLLALIAVGLIGYVVWRFTQAVKDPEHEGLDPSGLGKRAAFLVSGLFYGLLALYTLSLLLGFGGSGGGQSKDSMTAELMSHPGGIWAIAILGAIIIGVGIGQFTRAYGEQYKRKWRTAKMGITAQRWATRIAQWGLASRGIVFGIMGGFLIAAAWQADPSKATGLGGALDKLAGESYGGWLLAAVALGLICYGLYCFINARYRKINP